MKITNIKYVAIISFAISSLLIGCSEEVYEGAYKPSLESHYLRVSPRDYVFSNGEETKTGSISSENAWSFTNIPSWLSLSPTSGNLNAEFTITSKTNESISNREAVFYISANSTSKIQRTLTASQTGSSTYISFPEYNSSTITIEGKSDYLIIDVNSNIPDLTVAFSQSWAYASYNAEEKTVNIEIQANETNSSRNGTLTLSSAQYGKTAKLTISQLASGVTILEEGAIDYSADGGNQIRTIKSDLPWTAETTFSWIDFSPKSGNAGETTMTITALPSYESDKRIGQIYFYYGDTEKKYISITQTGRYLSLMPKAITLPAENCTETINIDSNIDWEVATIPDWISFSQNKGTAGNSNITITAQKNNSLNSRSATISIKDSMTGAIETNLLVTQDGLDFDVNTTMEFNWHQSSLDLEITLPMSWKAAVSDEWISLSDYIGNGSMSIIVSVSKNESEVLRNGEITLTSEGKIFKIKVIQTGQYITIDNTTGEFNAMGGVLLLTVASSINTSWEIEYSNNNNNWVHVDQIDDEYSIQVDYNPSINDRLASLRIIPTDSDTSDKYSQGVKYMIKQSGRKLTSDKSKIIMFARGGDSDVVHITCDGEYTIEKDPNDNWYTIFQQSDNNSFYLSIYENTSSIDRIGHINIMLKDVLEGEEKKLQIEIIQYHPVINIEFNSFDEDEDWNL